MSWIARPILTHVSTFDVGWKLSAGKIPTTSDSANICQVTLISRARGKGRQNLPYPSPNAETKYLNQWFHPYFRSQECRIFLF